MAKNIVCCTIQSRSSLTKYYNLLLFHFSFDYVEVIGEDASITDFDTNEAVSGLTIAKQAESTDMLAGVRVMKVTYTAHKRLPPGTSLAGLERLDVNHCTKRVLLDQKSM
eukprot:6180442-Pleurochrysis_carterae.AAC.6